MPMSAGKARACRMDPGVRAWSAARLSGSGPRSDAIEDDELIGSEERREQPGAAEPAASRQHAPNRLLRAGPPSTEIGLRVDPGQQLEQAVGPGQLPGDQAHETT